MTDLLILNCLKHSQSGLHFQLPISFQTVLKMDLEHIRILIYAFLKNRFIFSADSELVVFIMICFVRISISFIMSFCKISIFLSSGSMALFLNNLFLASNTLMNNSRYLIFSSVMSIKYLARLFHWHCILLQGPVFQSLFQGQQHFWLFYPSFPNLF